MCLGVPARVIQVKGDTALVDYGGVRRWVDALLQPDVKEGDYVIVHAGAIIAKIREEEAKELIKAWNELLKALNASLRASRS